MPSKQELVKDEKYNYSDDHIECWVDGEYNYELTVTINPSIYPITRAAFEEAEFTFKERLFYYLKHHKLIIDSVTIVKEYQKNRYPHWHCLISADEKIEPRIRQSMIGGFNQNVGKTSFKPVANLYAFQGYLQKDLGLNHSKHGFKHYVQYVLEDV